MTVLYRRKSGHCFFDFDYNGFKKSVCVDGWLNPALRPSFCKSTLIEGWERLPDDGYLTVTESSSSFEIICPTCFGYVSRRGFYRTTGAYHISFIFDKSEFFQIIYNFPF